MESNIKSISTGGAPEPRGHYAQATVHQRLIYVSTQLPIAASVAADEEPPEPGPIEQQARQVMENVLAIVEAGGGSAASLLRITIYISDIEHWPMINTLYTEILGNCRPARGVIPTSKLHCGYDIAADAIAAVE